MELGVHGVYSGLHCWLRRGRAYSLAGQECPTLQGRVEFDADDEKLGPEPGLG